MTEVTNEKVLKNTAEFFRTKSDREPNATTKRYVESMNIMKEKKND